MSLDSKQLASWLVLKVEQLNIACNNVTLSNLN